MEVFRYGNRLASQSPFFAPQGTRKGGLSPALSQMRSGRNRLLVRMLPFANQRSVDVDVVEDRLASPVVRSFVEDDFDRLNGAGDRRGWAGTWNGAATA